MENKKDLKSTKYKIRQFCNCLQEKRLKTSAKHLYLTHNIFMYVQNN